MRVKAGVRVNRLYFGDNLDVLREHVGDESVDLVYLDPPFNSKRDYNLLFKTPKGHESDAQITAFEDSWHWGEQAEREFDELLHQPNTAAAEMMRALRSSLGDNDVMAYLVMMANRLLELHRVLKPTGSLYLHCDPTASHYLKIVLDQVFKVENFKAEIIWKRHNARGTEANWPHIHDVILFYAKTSAISFTSLKVKADATKMPHTLVTGPDGEKYQSFELTGPGVTKDGESGQPWRGFNPSNMGRHWANSLSQRDEWDAAGLIHWPKEGGFPRRRDEFPFEPNSRVVTVGDVWTDIDRINQTAKERLGYPTQKPLALLERIVSASSKPGDVVLDPFCGCGTAIHAAQKLNRRWVGIDITHLAIALVEKRLRDAFRYLNHPPAPPTVPAYMQSYEVIGTPKDLAGARALAALPNAGKYQFQWWACSLVGAQPYQGKKKGADGGIDGIIFFQDDKGPAKKIVVSVKSGENVSVPMVRDLAHVVEREKAAIGLFVTLAGPTKPMTAEAVAAGFYTSPPTGAKFPKVQILTIEGLLEGTESARFPDLARGGHTFKTAAREQGKADQEEMFG